MKKVTPRYHTPVQDNLFKWCSEGWAIAENGTLAGSRGLVPGPDVWEGVNCSSPYFISIETPSLLLRHSTRADSSASQCRVLTIPPDHTWMLQAQARPMVGMTTHDGQAAVLIEEGPRCLPTSLAFLQRLPLLDKWLKQPVAPHFAIYTRPGHLRATLPLHHVVQVMTAFGAYTIPVKGVDLTCIDFTLSPDGHHLAVLTDDNRGKREILVYAW